MRSVWESNTRTSDARARNLIGFTTGLPLEPLEPLETGAVFFRAIQIAISRCKTRLPPVSPVATYVTWKATRESNPEQESDVENVDKLTRFLQSSDDYTEYE